MVMLQELEHLPNTFNHIQNPPQCPLSEVKQTLRRVLDMIESVGKVLKLLEQHHEISP